MDQDILKNKLQEIVEICKDGAEGYESASKNSENSELKTIFLRLSQQRKAFIEDVANEALRLGINLNKTGTVKGFFHRTWLATKATFTNETNKKVIEESMTGEQAAVEVYDKVLGEPGIPDYLREKLQDQQRLIKGALHQLNSLKSEI